MATTNEMRAGPSNCFELFIEVDPDTWRFTAFTASKLFQGESLRQRAFGANRSLRKRVFENEIVKKSDGVEILLAHLLECIAWKRRGSPEGKQPVLQGPQGSPAATLINRMSQHAKFLHQMLGDGWDDCFRKGGTNPLGQRKAWIQFKDGSLLDAAYVVINRHPRDILESEPCLEGRLDEPKALESIARSIFLANLTKGDPNAGEARSGIADTLWRVHWQNRTPTADLLEATLDAFQDGYYDISTFAQYVCDAGRDRVLMLPSTSRTEALHSAATELLRNAKLFLRNGSYPAAFAAARAAAWFAEASGDLMNAVFALKLCIAQNKKAGLHLLPTTFREIRQFAERNRSLPMHAPDLLRSDIGAIHLEFADRKVARQILEDVKARLPHFEHVSPSTERGRAIQQAAITNAKRLAELHGIAFQGGGAKDLEGIMDVCNGQLDLGGEHGNAVLSRFQVFWAHEQHRQAGRFLEKHMGVAMTSHEGTAALTLSAHASYLAKRGDRTKAAAIAEQSTIAIARRCIIPHPEPNPKEPLFQPWLLVEKARLRDILQENGRVSRRSGLNKRAKAGMDACLTALERLR